MHVIHARNVRDALPQGLRHLEQCGVVEESRAGPVIVAPWPVITVYEVPQERVLLAPCRDANPFFHLAEAIWMLAGRDDAAFLNEYVRDFGARFAEPDGRIHDAYGRRWRGALGFDQLDHVVETLRRDPTSRRCVIQMWDCYGGMNQQDLTGSWKTRPCNTHVYLRVLAEVEPVLDVTLCCRSNDMILGGYGANAVHFSILQEYLACRIGVAVGRLHQVSNNYHVYLSEVERLARRVDDRQDLDWRWQLCSVAAACEDSALEIDQRPPAPAPLFTEPGILDSDLLDLVRAVDDLCGWGGDELSKFVSPRPGSLTNAPLRTTIWRALRAHRMHRLGHSDTAMEDAHGIEDPEWRRACVEWLQRRAK
jgi:Thymidylate synthase